MVDLVVNKISPFFFNLIIIYCKTINDDDKWDHLLCKGIDQEFIHTSYSEEHVMEQYETISVLKEKFPQFRTLMIFDDMISDNVSNKHKIDMIAQLAVMGRHKGISVLFATQYYKALAPAVRTNATHVLVFFQSNGDEFDKIQKANCAHLSPQTFLRIYNQVFEGNDPHQTGGTGEKPFLQINNTRELKDRYWKNWNTPIQIEGYSDLGTKKDIEDPSSSSSEEEEDSRPKIK